MEYNYDSPQQGFEQNGGGNFYGSQNDPGETYRRQTALKRQIRTFGIYAGASFLLYTLLTNVASTVLSILGVYKSILSNPYYSCLFEMIASVLFMGVPFLIFGALASKKFGGCDFAPLEKPNDGVLSVLSVPMALGWCMAANILTGYIISIMSLFGMELSQPSLPEMSGATGLILNIIRVSVLAPIIEEVTIRGCIMQPLRRYSEKFAIVISACVFGLIHGNLVQAPFAFLVGLVLGYICIKTDSLWPSIIVHSLNNSISLMFSQMSSYMTTERVNLIYSAFVAAVFVTAIVAGLLFMSRARKTTRPLGGGCPLSVGQKVSAYVVNPTVIASLIIIAFITAVYIKFYP